MHFSFFDILETFSFFLRRQMTAASTKTSPQNITLLYHKSFAIIPSCSRLTLSVKYPRNELEREISEWKERNKRFTVACSRCPHNCGTGHLTSLKEREPLQNVKKRKMHVRSVQKYCLSFSNMQICGVFVAVVGVVT